ncbi:MAG: sulfur carrier protein ThiS [Bacillota bacterium]
MSIHVLARGQVARLLPPGADNQLLPWSGPLTVAELLCKLGIEAKMVTVVVDGQRVDERHQLRDGAKVLLFTPMAGG